MPPTKKKRDSANPPDPAQAPMATNPAVSAPGKSATKAAVVVNTSGAEEALEVPKEVGPDPSSAHDLKDSKDDDGAAQASKRAKFHRDLPGMPTIVKQAWHKVSELPGTRFDQVVLYCLAATKLSLLFGSNTYKLPQGRRTLNHLVSSEAAEHLSPSSSGSFWMNSFVPT